MTPSGVSTTSDHPQRSSMIPFSTWRMPSETAPQERIFMGFPPLGELFGATHDAALVARTAWSEVANTIAGFLPVEMVVAPGDQEVARSMLTSSIQLHEAPLDEAWMRDFGPTFVVGENGQLGAVDWGFNGWGSSHHAGRMMRRSVPLWRISRAQSWCRPTSSTRAAESMSMVVAPCSSPTPSNSIGSVTLTGPGRRSSGNLPAQ